MRLLDITIAEKTFPAAGQAAANPVMQHVTMHVERGEVVALTGPSGCGKSTLLSMIAGLDDDYRGLIRYNAGTSLAMVFQEPRLLPWRSVYDNLALILPESADRDQKIKTMLEAVGLGDQADVFASRLSLGMARRVALARAFIVEPDLILLDEPFASLDERNARKLRGLLLDLLTNRRVTALFVTHDLGEAVELADRILVMGCKPATIRAEETITLEPEARRDSLRREICVRDVRQRLFSDQPEEVI